MKNTCSTNWKHHQQFERIQSGELSAIPHQLIMDKIYDVLRTYRYGCAE
ncbi:Tagatose-6-phosphate kinase [Shigella dysenteriae 1617]|uniref:Tagatose-6-phosphate kinase n=1 Tax=Shigella dysenteriae 1617 TaxID=754093 RepID=A0A0A6ZUW6_SHIDY|nr:Tagatose-6-phosphate kinase [Shigella dysenteriae 1617]